MITPVKVARVQRAAAAWLARNPRHADLAIRFDVIAERAGRIEHVPYAF
jgi:Holliday junction resolvase-like predicted endonuclease